MVVVVVVSSSTLTAEPKSILERCFNEEKIGAQRAVVQTNEGGV